MCWERCEMEGSVISICSGGCWCYFQSLAVLYDTLTSYCHCRNLLTALWSTLRKHHLNMAGNFRDLPCTTQVNHLFNKSTPQIFTSTSRNITQTTAFTFNIGPLTKPNPELYSRFRTYTNGWRMSLAFWEWTLYRSELFGLAVYRQIYQNLSAILCPPKSQNG